MSHLKRSHPHTPQQRRTHRHKSLGIDERLAPHAHIGAAQCVICGDRSAQTRQRGRRLVQTLQQQRHDQMACVAPQAPQVPWYGTVILRRRRQVATVLDRHTKAQRLPQVCHLAGPQAAATQSVTARAEGRTECACVCVCVCVAGGPY
jgi:hypothetical protein